jgi:hypothetical protein
MFILKFLNDGIIIKAQAEKRTEFHTYKLKNKKLKEGSYKFKICTSYQPWRNQNLNWETWAQGHKCLEY